MKTDDQHLATRRAEPRHSIPNGLLSATSESSKHNDDPRIIAAVEEFLRQCETGLHPDVEAFVAERPEIAGMLRQCLAGLEFVQAAVPEIEASAAGIDQVGLSESLSGQALGDYRIVREVGRGGMGIVYEAEQISLRRRVALKVLPFAAMLDPRHLQRFKNEALAAASLDHPNIVEVYGVGCERGVHFYAMKYVEGQTLAAVIEELRGERREASHSSRLAPRDEASCATGSASALCATAGLPSSADPNPEPRTLNPPSDTAIAALSTLRTTRPKDFFRRIAELGIQAAEALDHAHQMGIVHRDIKPSNLILECSHLAQCSHLAPRVGASPLPSRGEAGRGVKGSLTTDHQPLTTPKLYITDFGLARVQNEPGMTMTGDLLGTLRYMSPEQALAKRVVVDHRTDIYSLGVTLYELLTGRPAFDGADRQAVLHKIAFDEPTPPRKLNPAISTDLETIVLKAMAKTPDERYSTARDLADDLRRFAEQKPIQAKPPTLWERTTKFARRHTSLLFASLVALLLTTIGFAVAAFLIAQAYRDKAEETKRADVAREQADARSSFAKKVVDEMYTKVARKWLANEPRMTPLQKEFLDKALSFYDELAREQPTDPASRHGRAMAMYRTSDIQLALGRREDALERVEEAHSELARVVAKQPDNPQYQSDLANICMKRGVLMRELGRSEVGLASLEEAIERWNDLVKQYPDEAKYRGNLADAQMNLGATLMGSPESERLLRRAISTYRLLILDGVNVGEHSIDVGRASINLANTLHRLNRPTEALETLEKAISLVQPLTESNDMTQDAREILFGTYHATGVILLKMNRCPEALEPLQKATAILESLATDFPETVRYHERLAKVSHLCDKLRAAMSASESNAAARLLDEIGNMQLH